MRMRWPFSMFFLTGFLCFHLISFSQDITFQFGKAVLSVNARHCFGHDSGCSGIFMVRYRQRAYLDMTGIVTHLINYQSKNLEHTLSELYRMYCC